MSITYDVDQDTRVVRGRAGGTLLGPELMTLLDALAADEHIKLPLLFLFDGRDVEHVDVPTADLRRVLNAFDLQARHFGPSRVALVAAQPLLFGIARMAQGLSFVSPHELRAFREIAPAEAWLLEQDGP